jgi:hypothetical protein
MADSSVPGASAGRQPTLFEELGPLDTAEERGIIETTHPDGGV